MRSVNATMRIPAAAAIRPRLPGVGFAASSGAVVVPFSLTPRRYSRVDDRPFSLGAARS
jgi:hypothetical protein